MSIYLLLGSLCGLIVLATVIALPFAIRRDRRDAKDGVMTTGTIVGAENSIVNECWFLDVRYVVERVPHQVRVRTHRDHSVGDVMPIRYMRSDPSTAYQGSSGAISIWRGTISLVVVGMVSLGAAVILFSLGA